MLHRTASAHQEVGCKVPFLSGKSLTFWQLAFNWYKTQLLILAYFCHVTGENCVLLPVFRSNTRKFWPGRQESIWCLQHGWRISRIGTPGVCPDRWPPLFPWEWNLEMAKPGVFWRRFGIPQPKHNPFPSKKTAQNCYGHHLPTSTAITVANIQSPADLPVKSTQKNEPWWANWSPRLSRDLPLVHPDPWQSF